MKPASRILPVRCSLTAFVGRRHTVVRDQLFPQKPLGSPLCFSRTGVQHSPGSSTIELPSALVESGAYPPDRALTGSPRQCSLPLACRHLPKGAKLEHGRGKHRRTPSSAKHTAAATDRLTRDDSQSAAFLEGDPGLAPLFTKKWENCIFSFVLSPFLEKDNGNLFESLKIRGH